MITYSTLDIDGLWSKKESKSISWNKLVPRFPLDNIVNRFSKNYIEIVIGPRQSGKTTLLRMLIHELNKQEIHKDKIFYINLDTAPPLEQFENPMLLVKLLSSRRQGKERLYLFIDEVQRLKNPGKFLKGIYDLEENIKIFVSGSSSLEIKSKIKEYLTGRKRETYLLPISYREYVDFEKKIPISLDQIPLEPSTIGEWRESESLYGEYLRGKMAHLSIYGSYPAVLMEKDSRERMEVLAEIYRSYLKKDVVEFLKIGNSEVFSHLLKVLASQVGNLINKSELCSLLGSNSVTLTKYMDILKETYVTGYLPPYVSSKRNEVKSSHKCYFIDNGLRNFAIRHFNALEDRSDRGALIENLVFGELAKNGFLLDEGLHYWRTKGGAEMDFVISHNGSNLPVEIKSGPAKPGLLSRSFHSYLDNFSPTQAIFLNRNLFHIQQFKKTQVFYIPNHWFLLYGPALLG